MEEEYPCGRCAGRFVSGVSLFIFGGMETGREKRGTSGIRRERLVWLIGCVVGQVGRVYVACSV